MNIDEIRKASGTIPVYLRDGKPPEIQKFQPGCFNCNHRATLNARYHYVTVQFNAQNEHGDQEPIFGGVFTFADSFYERTATFVANNVMRGGLSYTWLRPQDIQNRPIMWFRKTTFFNSRGVRHVNESVNLWNIIEPHQNNDIMMVYAYPNLAGVYFEIDGNFATLPNDYGKDGANLLSQARVYPGREELYMAYLNKHIMRIDSQRWTKLTPEGKNEQQKVPPVKQQARPRVRFEPRIEYNNIFREAVIQDIIAENRGERL